MTEAREDALLAIGETLRVQLAGVDIGGVRHFS